MSRNRATEGLRRTEARFRTLIENALDMVTVIEADGTITYQNKSATAVTGYDPSDRIGGNSLEHIHEDDRAAVRRTLEKVAAKGGAVGSAEFRLRRKDGEWREVESVYRNMLDDPVVAGILINSRDITERKEAERALQESEALLRAILDNSPASIAIRDAEGRYRVVNQTYERRLGVKNDEIVGKTPADIIRPDVADIIERYDRQVVESGEPLLHEHESATNEGRDTLLTSRFPIRDAAGEIVGVGSIATDITEPKEAERALRESEELLRAVLDNSPAIIAIRDTEGRYQLVNRAYEKMFGVTSDEIIGKRPDDIMPPEFAAALEKYDRQVIESRKSLWHEHDAVLEHGGDTLLSTRFPIRDAAGEIVGVGSIATDITERKEVEDARRESEARFRDFTDSASDWLWEMDENLRFSFVSELAQKLSGVPPDKMIGQTREDLISKPEEREKWRPHLEDLEARRPFSDFRYTFVRADGKELVFSISGKPVFDDDGSFKGYRGVGRDITERTRIERQVTQNEERFRKLIEGALDIITVIDRDWTIKYQSPSGLVHTGYEPASRIGQNGLEFIHEEDRPRATAIMDRIVANPDEAARTEFRLQREDGSWRTFEAIFRNLLDDPVVAGIVLNSRDITDQKQAEEQLRQSQKMEAVGQLTGGIAHDFNNLLAVILGNLDLAADQLDEHDELRDLLEKSIGAATRGAELTGQLLAYSRKQTLRPSTIDVNKHLGSMIELLGRALGENIEINTVLSGDLWPVMIDPGQVENAIVNLAVNARDAMPEGGTLTVETANAPLGDRRAATRLGLSPGDYVRVSVSDTGTGMPPEVVEHAFEPFYTTKDAGMGTGLGLSMVYGFVNQSGGHVTIESEPDKGTRISLYLPRTEQPADCEEKAEAPEIPQGAGERILVVEDDPDLRVLAEAMLRGLGYDILTAANGGEALLALTGTPDIDLLLTDIVLPGGMTGTDLARKARMTCHDLRVLYMSGYAENTALPSEQSDSDDLLQKPFRKRDLAMKLREALTKH